LLNPRVVLSLCDWAALFGFYSNRGDRRVVQGRNKVSAPTPTPRCGRKRFWSSEEKERKPMSLKNILLIQKMFCPLAQL